VAITAGAGQSGAELRFALAAIIITLGFLWTSWLFIGVYIGWRDGSMNAGAGMMTMLRGLLVLAVIGAFIR
jgi:integrating conjugative element protein (TIGR03758 family)